MIKCPYCAFETSLYVEFVKHYVKKHRLEKSFQVTCGLCNQTFVEVASLKSHVTRTHSDVLQHEGIRPGAFVAVAPDEVQPSSSSAGASSTSTFHDFSTLNPPECVNETDESDNDGSEDSFDEDNECAAEISTDELELLKWESARCLLRLREEAMISQTAVGKAANIVGSLYDSQTDAIKEALLQGTTPEGSIPKEHILQTFAAFGSSGLFHGVHSRQLQDFVASDNFEYLEPLKIPLYNSEEIDLKGNLTMVEHCAYGSRFLPSLERLLTRPDILYCLDHPIEHEEGVYKTFMDGSYCRSHPILSQPNSLGIQLCYDDLEVSSPLGPMKHKLSFYNWTLLNIHSELRSLLRSINLLAVAWTEDMKMEIKSTDPFVSVDPKYQHHCKILKPFKEDLKTLEQGIVVECNGQNREFKGVLVNVTGDTPAVGILSGTKESVGPAHMPCHHCLGDHYEVQAIFSEKFFDRRNAANRGAYLQSLREATSVKEREAISVASGYNGPSVFEELSPSMFDHVECFLFDTMHILHEGVLELHMRLLLNYYVNEKKLFDLKTINRECKKLSKHLYTKDRPAAIKDHHLSTGLRQSASQMLSLALCLPLVLKRNPDKEGRLENFVLLLKVVNGLLCYESTDAELDKLQQMIEQHNETFMVHYPDCVTPKWHYLIHLVTQIRKYGPTRYTWCMRYEGHLRYYKRLVQIMQNFINLPKSIATRYESLRACQMMTPPGQKTLDFLYTKPKCIATVNIQVKDVPLLSNVFGNPNLRVQSCEKLLLKGVTFAIGKVVLLKMEPPVFGFIKNIYVKEDIFTLSVSVEDNATYEPLSNTFKFCPSSSNTIQLVFIENLAFIKPLPFVHIDGYVHVIPKYSNLNFTV